MTNKADAVIKIRPAAVFTWNGDDPADINFDDPNVEPVSSQELDAAFDKLQKENLAKEKAKADIRDSAIQHAKSLGFTDEMISVMYPTLMEQ